MSLTKTFCLRAPADRVREYTRISSGSAAIHTGTGAMNRATRGAAPQEKRLEPLVPPKSSQPQIGPHTRLAAQLFENKFDIH